MHHMRDGRWEICQICKGDGKIGNCHVLWEVGGTAKL